MDAIFPLANEEQRDNGWTFTTPFIRAIREAAEAHGFDGSDEDVQAVLVAVQSHCLIALAAARREGQERCGVCEQKNAEIAALLDTIVDLEDKLSRAD